MARKDDWTNEEIEEDRGFLLEYLQSVGWEVSSPLTAAEDLAFTGSALDRFYSLLYGASWDSSKKSRACLVVNHPRADKGAHYVIVNRENIVQESVNKGEAFIYAGSFWQPGNGYTSTEGTFQSTVNALVVDIDREPGYHYMGNAIGLHLEETIFPDFPEVRPNYITLTGTGVQLWYIFPKGIVLYGKTNPRRERYNGLAQELYRWWSEHLYSNRGKVDLRCASINHAFRAPASPTKQGYRTILLADGTRPYKPTDPAELAAFLGYRFNEWDGHEKLTDADIELIRQRKESWEEGIATEKQLELINHLHEIGAISDEAFAEAADATRSRADAIIKEAEKTLTRWRNYKVDNGVVQIDGGVMVPRKPRYPKLYQYVLERIPQKTPAGTRYYALVALAGYAYNCNIPKKQLEADMRSLLDSDMARLRSKRDNKPLEERDIKAALKAYKPLGVLTHRAIAEEFLGWPFEEKKKIPRNHRSRHDHLWKKEFVDTKTGRPKKNLCYENREAALEYMREQKQILGRPSKKDEIQKYAAEHPEANHSEIARALGVSRPTVIKWLKTK